VAILDWRMSGLRKCENSKLFKIFKIIRREYSKYSKYSKLFAGSDKNPRLVHELSYRTEVWGCAENKEKKSQKKASIPVQSRWGGSRVSKILCPRNIETPVSQFSQSQEGVVWSEPMLTWKLSRRSYKALQGRSLKLQQLMLMIKNMKWCTSSQNRI